MEIYFHQQNLNNIYLPDKKREVRFRGREGIVLKRVGESADKIMRRPVANKSATGLHGLEGKSKSIFSPVVQYVKNYIGNLKHTCEHKKIFALYEKEFFIKKHKRELAHNKDIESLRKLYNSYVDMCTHDLDKLFLYILGFPRETVSKIHRAHSEHHWQSGKKLNLESVACDNMASVHKPGRIALRDYYFSSPELQGIDGLGEIFEKYDYGEHIDITKLAQKQKKDSHNPGIGSLLAKIAPLIIANFI